MISTATYGVVREISKYRAYRDERESQPVTENAERRSGKEDSGEASLRVWQRSGSTTGVVIRDFYIKVKWNQLNHVLTNCICSLGNICLLK